MEPQHPSAVTHHKQHPPNNITKNGIYFNGAYCGYIQTFLYICGSTGISSKLGGVTTGAVFICCSSGADPNSIIYPRIDILYMIQDETMFITLNYYMGIWVSMIIGGGITCAFFQVI